ncbi:hypothetical protein ACJX0J_016218, partial [Zea mays]
LLSFFTLKGFLWGSSKKFYKNYTFLKVLEFMHNFMLLGYLMEKLGLPTIFHFWWLCIGPTFLSLSLLKYLISKLNNKFQNSTGLWKNIIALWFLFLVSFFIFL